MAQLFKIIATKLKSVVNDEFIQSIKTFKGNTQSSERVVIQKIRDVFGDLELSYEEAGSQQSKDFRNVGGIGLDIEIKKPTHPMFTSTILVRVPIFIILYSLPEKNINQKKYSATAFVYQRRRIYSGFSMDTRLYTRNKCVERQIRAR